ncbi:MAG: hypothetical protein GY832_21215 [Chloroflexi bacterium]|nr:hypothetical protein [Chloroflexota bacterium]
MNRKQLASRTMLTGGIVEILIAILHFLMPLEFARAGAIAELPTEYRDFVLHGIVAVGLCLTVFGALSIYFSRKLLLGDTTAWTLGISQGILWSGRTITELIFPIKVPLFFISNPTSLILPLVALLALLYLVPLMMCKETLFRKENRATHSTL